MKKRVSASVRAERKVGEVFKPRSDERSEAAGSWRSVAPRVAQLAAACIGAALESYATPRPAFLGTHQVSNLAYFAAPPDTIIATFPAAR